MFNLDQVKITMMRTLFPDVESYGYIESLTDLIDLIDNIKLDTLINATKEKISPKELNLDITYSLNDNCYSINFHDKDDVDVVV